MIFLFLCYVLRDLKNNNKNQSGYEPLNFENGSPVNSDDFDATDLDVLKL